MNKADILYGLEDDEELYPSIEEVSERFVEQVDDIVKEKHFVVYEFKRIQMTESIAELVASRAVHDAIECLDDEYGEPGASITDLTVEMKEAKDALKKAILESYVPWACERTGKSFDVYYDNGNVTYSERNQ